MSTVALVLAIIGATVFVCWRLDRIATALEVRERSGEPRYITVTTTTR